MSHTTALADSQLLEVVDAAPKAARRAAAQSAAVLGLVPAGTSVSVAVEGQDPVQLPRQIERALAIMLREAAEGHTVAVVTIGQEDLTTTQAARLLGVSRPHVVKLIDSGFLQAHRAGTARRVRAADVAAYKRVVEERHAILDELAAEAQDMGFYEIQAVTPRVTKRVTKRAAQ
jgi:excisionase family DNA binding protein